jgi:hypothetical protein
MPALTFVLIVGMLCLMSTEGTNILLSLIEKLFF